MLQALWVGVIAWRRQEVQSNYTQLVYIIKRAGGWGGGGPFLGLGDHWMLVLIELLQQLHFYGPPSHLWLSQPSSGCWPLAGCSRLEWIHKQEQAFMLTAKCKWLENRKIYTRKYAFLFIHSKTNLFFTNNLGSKYETTELHHETLLLNICIWL